MSEPDAPRYQTIDAGPRQVVHSPEQVELHLPVAGPTTRMLSYAIDWVALLVLWIVALVTLLLATPAATWLARLFDGVKLHPGQAPEDLEPILFLFAFFLLVQLVVEWGYFIAFETLSNGRSLGKRLMGLRVVRDGGLPITLREAAVRNLLRTVDVLPANYLVGLIAMLLSEQGKRLGDLAAGTVVVRLDRPAPAEPLPADAPEAQAGFRFDRAQLGLLGPRERALVRQTLRRLDQLPPETAARSLEMAVEALRARLGYGPVAPEERLAFLRAVLHAIRAE